MKRRRRQYPARSSFDGIVSKKLIGRFIILLALAAVGYFAYPEIVRYFNDAGVEDDSSMAVGAEAEKSETETKAPPPQPVVETKTPAVQPQEPQIAASSIQVEVLNGCGKAGLASRITDSLRTKGYDVVKMGNFQSKNVSETLVIQRSVKKGAGQSVADYLGTKNVVTQSAPELMLDVTIVIGHDYQKLNVFK